MDEFTSEPLIAAARIHVALGSAATLRNKRAINERADMPYQHLNYYLKGKMPKMPKILRE